jgi:serpin B
MLTRRDALRSLLLTGAAAAAGPTLAGCGSEQSGARAAAAVRLPATPLARADLSTLPAAVTAVQSFTADLYRQVAAKPGNLACSPYSIAVALAMTRNGARARTAAEMDRVLYAPPLPRLNSGLNALSAHVESRAGSKKHADGSTDVVVDVANSLFGQQGMPWEPAFLDALGRDYGAGLQLVDYRRRDEAAARINAWVAERTRNRIRDLVPPAALDALTRLVLVNAIYLKAAWASRSTGR